MFQHFSVLTKTQFQEFQCHSESKGLQLTIKLNMFQPTDDVCNVISAIIPCPLTLYNSSLYCWNWTPSNSPGVPHQEVNLSQYSSEDKHFAIWILEDNP